MQHECSYVHQAGSGGALRRKKFTRITAAPAPPPTSRPPITTPPSPPLLLGELSTSVGASILCNPGVLIPLAGLNAPVPLLIDPATSHNGFRRPNTHNHRPERGYASPEALYSLQRHV